MANNEKLVINIKLMDISPEHASEIRAGVTNTIAAVLGVERVQVANVVQYTISKSLGALVLEAEREITDIGE